MLQTPIHSREIKLRWFSHISKSSGIANKISTRHMKEKDEEEEEEEDKRKRWEYSVKEWARMSFLAQEG